ncbi:MAG: extracellular solute-binding protein [Ruthenibacterium sp.]
MKRNVFIVGLLLCGCLFLCACGATPQTTGGTLRVCLDEETLYLYRPWVQRFAQENPDVKIEYVKIPSSFSVKTGQSTPQLIEKRAQFLEKLRVDIMAGKGPDVYIANTYYAGDPTQDLFPDLEKSMRAGVFANAEELMQQDKSFDRSAFLPQVMRAGQMDGKQYLFPLGYNTQGLLVTDALLQATGFDVEKSQSSPAAFLEQCQNLWAEFPDVMPLLQTPLLDYNAAKVQLDDEAFRTILPLWKNYMRQDLPEKTALDDEHFAECVAPKTNYDRLFIAGSGINAEKACYWAKDGEAKMQLVPVPNETGKVNGTVCAIAAIGANSKNKQTAFALVNLLLSNEAQMGEIENTGTVVLLSSTNGGLPVRRDSIQAYLQSFVQKTAEHTGVVLPDAATLDSFSAVEEKLDRVCLPESTRLQQELQQALTPYFEGKAETPDADLAALSQKWSYYLTE